MTARCVLAIDQGTTSSKVVLVDERGRVVARASRPVETQFPQPGWVQQDAEQIWASVVGAARECLDRAGTVQVAAIGISNQRETVLAWDRATGEALGPCVTWQCRRTSPFCDELKARGLAERIEGLTGLTVDPLFSASKARWLLDSLPSGQDRAAAGEIYLGTMDSWLVWKLTGGAVHATDASNASRTQLVNLATGDWDDWLLALFGIPRAALPEIRASDTGFGAAVGGDFPCAAPISGVAGDSHAALFGHGAFAPGVVKATFGTGSSLMALAKAAPRAAGGISATVAWRLGPALTWAVEGNIASTGATLEWVGRLLGHLDDPGGVCGRMAAEVADSGGVTIVPAFSGLGAPHWDDQARGLICGLTRGADGRHLARAALESTAFQVADVYDAMQAGQTPLGELRADGGASRNDLLMQFQADILGRAVVRDVSADLSAFGAACLAGLGAGLWALAELAALPRATERFEPRMARAEAEARRDGWRAAVARARLRPQTAEGP